jgi:beta-glucanase (GH16 family)
MLTAIWMLPWQNKYGRWPASGEINIAESRGNRQLNYYGDEIGVKRAISALHWGPNSGENRFEMTNYHKNINDGFDRDFHLFQVQWTPGIYHHKDLQIKFSVLFVRKNGYWIISDCLYTVT